MLGLVSFFVKGERNMYGLSALILIFHLSDQLSIKFKWSRRAREASTGSELSDSITVSSAYVAKMILSVWGISDEDIEEIRGEIATLGYSCLDMKNGRKVISLKNREGTIFEV